MSIWDWIIVIGLAGIMLSLTNATRKYVRGVSDFLAANRLAGRYMLTIGGQASGTGVIAIVGLYEAGYIAGFTSIWWGLLGLPVGVILALTGFVYYRYRETRALTLAQFFETRYSTNFRKFAGIVCFLTGLINFGVFPAVAARFYVNFLGLSETFPIPGTSIEVSTFATLMALDLGVALLMVIFGGQISIMLSDCFSGIVSLLGFVAITAFALWLVGWQNIMEATRLAPENASMVHPMKGGEIKDFNVWFYLIGILNFILVRAAWQGSQGYNASAKSPHEQKMGVIIGGWRWDVQTWMGIVIAVATFALLNLPEFSQTSSVVQARLDAIGNETIQNQMRVPITLSEILPIGLKGLFLAVMIFCSIGTHNTYMHSWGSIFIQDVWIPFRKKIYTPGEHIRLLRVAVTGVALYAFTFGLFHTPNTPIFMFWAITGTIWLPGAGAAVIGGLYWKKGTTTACYLAILFGAFVGFFGLIYPPIYITQFGQDFPLNNQYLYFIAIVGAALIYIFVSLLTYKGVPFNLEKMLHRGKWSIASDHEPVETNVHFLQKFFGINRDFSLADRVLAVALVCWNAFWIVLFTTVTLVNVASPLTVSWWESYWKVYIFFYLGFNALIAIWFTIGGSLDIRGLFAALKTAERREDDDGRAEVINNETSHSPR
jgi:SSS family solute:Na+ symporter